MTNQDTFHSIVDKLTQERDELRLKINLAGKEIRDDWHVAEEKFDQLQVRAKDLTEKAVAAGHEAADAGGDVWAAVEVLAEEVGDLFKRVRSKLS